MKFVCDRCQTKYSIADEKVRGKILKVRCKTCSNVITVREATAVKPSSPSLAPIRDVSGVRASSPSLAPVRASSAPAGRAPAPAGVRPSSPSLSAVRSAAAAARDDDDDPIEEQP